MPSSSALPPPEYAAVGGGAASASTSTPGAPGVGTSNHVYIWSEEFCWIPARLLHQNNPSNDAAAKKTSREATVSVLNYTSEDDILPDPHAPTSNNSTLRSSFSRSLLSKTKTTTKATKSLRRVEQTISLQDYPSQTLPLQNVDDQGDLVVVKDLVELPFLNEPAILYNLKWRHVQQEPYTRTGDIIIACNPYQWLPHLYSPQQRQWYSEVLVWKTRTVTAESSLEPHVYETSSGAYRGLALDGEDQSILVSGESGAGKTETVKILLSALASVQQGIPQQGSGSSILFLNDESEVSNASVEYHSPIVQRVLDSNPLLEAFGNAQTIRNDNSSRFGKFIQLQFDAEDPVQAAYQGKVVPSCVLAGSQCEVYLLEKSRVVTHEPNERTFHIFYQLLSSSDEQKAQIWPGLRDATLESFKYVGATDTHVIEHCTDAERFQQTVAALELIQVTGDRLQTLWQALVMVLQLGNLNFDVDAHDETKSVIAEDGEKDNALDGLSELTGIAKSELIPALTIRTVKARREEFKVPLPADTAKESCDAFAKEIYNSAFLWLVRAINAATAAEYNYESAAPRRGGGYATIGLLDIFGFESFDTNRFEQFCINYANEKLQQKFTQDVFRSVQAEYEYEGIELEEIAYDDNSDVLNMIEARLGLLNLLNEECVRPGGSDKGFVAKMTAANKDASCFFRLKGFDEHDFGIHHYAGKVIYTAEGFVTKNMDTLPTDLQECARKSTNDILRDELGNEAMMKTTGGRSTVTRHHSSTHGSQPHRHEHHKTNSPKRSGSASLVGVSVSSKFKNQLTMLMTNLKRTRTRYIRCIKPNAYKQPKLMQHRATVEQLRCAGVVAAVTISRSAFPNRLEHCTVVERFRAVWGKHQTQPQSVESELDDPEERTKQLVDRMLTRALHSLETQKADGTTQRAYVLGRTRTYFRAGALEYLENERVQCLSRWAIEVQRTVRQYMVRSRYIRYRQRIIALESAVRMILARRHFLHFRAAAIHVQCWQRSLAAQQQLVMLRRQASATRLQAYWRRVVAMMQFQSHRRAAVSVQRVVRGALQRPRYRAELLERREEARLENQVVALQRKLEEAERRRVEAEQRAETTQKQNTEEKKDDPGAAAAAAASVTSDKSSVSRSAIAPTPGQLSAQQQTLMDESGKMLEYLRKEVFKLRSHNAKMREDFDLLKDNNQRLMDANASAGASFQALNQHAKQLSRANDKLRADCQSFKQQVQKLSVTQVELKEELKMKQATYVAEVHSRLQYQKALSRIIDVAQERCRDDRLVEEFLRIADACEAEYMNGPTGMEAAPSPLSALGGGVGSPRRQKRSGDGDGLMSSIRNLWS